VSVGLIGLTRAGWDPMHAWNRAFADVSLLMLILTLACGPIARLWPRAARLVLWRGEMGVWSILAALGHVVIVMTGWVEWDVLRLFYSVNPFKRDWALDQGFALGNLLGIIALLYGVVLAVTSNDASIRLLGGSPWKFVQQGVYVLYALVALHTAYFLFFHFVTFHRPPVPANWMERPFLVLVVVLFVLQTAALLATVRRRRAMSDASGAAGLADSA
jgi:methionine sulfoxide reductase heme-binding subunit